jgi:chromosomal replication initiator protein
VGCGKTHLAQAIVAAARKGGNYRRCLCLSAEQFTTGFIEGLHGKGLPLFRNKYRQLDLLALDGVQFLSGKKATIVEFQNTMEAMLRAGKQIVITVDRPLFELDFLGESLTTRLASGMTCPIAWPDLESRIRIVENHARSLGVSLKNDTIRHVCERMGRDVRMLFGAINRVHAATTALRKSIDPPTASQLLSDLFQSQTPLISMERIEHVVCDVCGVSPAEIRGQKRIRRVSTARMLAIWLTRQHTTAGLAEIGEYFGGRNHSTVVAARKKIDAMQVANAEIDIKSQRVKLSEALERLESQLRAG